MAAAVVEVVVEVVGAVVGAVVVANADVEVADIDVATLVEVVGKSDATEDGDVVTGSVVDDAMVSSGGGTSGRATGGTGDVLGCALM